MKYSIITFGCQQNKADSERIASAYKSKGFAETEDYRLADHVVVNTCMVRQSAENRAFGLINNLGKIKEEKFRKGFTYKIIVTGCMVGLAFRDKTGKYLKHIREIMPQVDEFMPVEEVGFDNEPVRQDKTSAWIPISNGCNNFCTFCIVPFTRGREISRPYRDIIDEAAGLRNKGYANIILLGQNVNSYGADLVIGEKNIQVMRDIKTRYFKPQVGHKSYTLPDGREIEPVYVKHLGRQRIPTLFPYLLEEVARMGFDKVDFVSSNPWDFSDDLIDVIAKNGNITRTIHLPVQSGDDRVLKRMNRWYTRIDYLALTHKMKSRIEGLKLTTDIIVGFCGETDGEFENTVALCKEVNFHWAYIARYSERFGTAATKVFKDDVPHKVKKKRWEILDELINKPKLAKYIKKSPMS